MREKYYTPCVDCGKLNGPYNPRCLPCHYKTRSGAGNPNWVDGRNITHQGYIKLIAPVGHPRAGKRVPEHHLVMEQHLGRYLAPGENVHHKNGIRDDNRIENLELWFTGQPGGQRATDLLAWADEIIWRYREKMEMPKVQSQSQNPRKCYSLSLV